MGKRSRKHVDDLRGVSRLAVEATKGVTELVEAMHRTIASGPRVLGRPLEGAARFFTAPVYGSIRAVTDLVGGALDAALAQLAPLLGESTPGPEREAVLAALNGVLGDYLAETGNPLAIEMRFQHRGHPLDLETDALREAIPDAKEQVLILVHGSCMNDQQMRGRDRDPFASLAEHLGSTAIHLHYNSGLHVSTNGRAFDASLERLISAWPVPISGIAIVAHSMGGLVSRSACHYAEAPGHAWRKKLRALVFLGTPHHGAPLERGGNFIDFLLGATPYSAPLARLGKIRSAGVTDLRYGFVLDEHWEGRDRFALGADRRTPLPLPEGVECYAIAATTAPGPRDDLPGDGLVPLASALGQHRDPARTLQFPESHRFIAYGRGHLDLLRAPEVFERIEAWLAEQR